MVVAQERYDHYSLPEEESRPSRRPRRSRLPSKGRFALSGLVFLTFCTGMLIAFYYTQVIISGYKVSGLSNELSSLQQETNSLAEEVDRLNSLNMVEYLATTRLKMVKPDSKSIVMIKADLAGSSSKNYPAVAEGQGYQKVDRQEDLGQNPGKSKMIQAFAYLMGIKGS